MHLRSKPTGMCVIQLKRKIHKETTITEPSIASLQQRQIVTDRIWFYITSWFYYNSQLTNATVTFYNIAKPSEITCAESADSTVMHNNELQKPINNQINKPKLKSTDPTSRKSSRTIGKKGSWFDFNWLKKNTTHKETIRNIQDC